MTVKEVEAKVIQYCKVAGIVIVNGKIPERNVEEIKIFLRVLKKQFKKQRKFERENPKSIKEIKIL